MFWRKELIISDRTFQEKIDIIREKCFKRDYIIGSVIIYSFLGLFFLSLLLISFGALGRFPRSTFAAIFAWIVPSGLIYALVNLIRRILFKKDERTISSIKLDEKMKNIWKEYK
jgi:hypothetical protein